MITLFDAIKIADERAHKWPLYHEVAIARVKDCAQCWMISYDYITPESQRDFSYPHPTGGPGLFVAVKKSDGSDITWEVYCDKSLQQGTYIEPPKEYRVPWYTNSD